MRALLLNIAINALYIAFSALEAIRSRHTYYRYLGKFWFLSVAYFPSAIGVGADFDFQSRDEFSLSLDIGPVTITVGRDWAVEL